MDVNEKIVIAWLEELNNMFTKSNIFYGQFHSDIDILAVKIDSKIAWDCEIKIRTGSTKIADNSNKQNGFYHITSTLNSDVRKKTLDSLIPNGYMLIKKLITTKSFFGSDKNQEKWIAKFKENNIDVIFIEDILSKSYEYSKKLKKSTNEVFQTLKLLSKI